MEIKWTFEKCLKDAKKYRGRTQWFKHSQTAYQTSRKKGWLDKCCEHMILFEYIKPFGYWTKERCIEDAKLYNTKGDWSKNSKGYKAASSKGWLKDCCLHMDQGWTKEACIEDAKKYATRGEWSKKSTGYSSAWKKGWLEECCLHMPKLDNIKPHGYWTKERCIEDAKPYNTIGDWSKNSNGYKAASSKGWLSDCCSHMNKKLKWTKESCIEDAKKYKTRGEWSKNSGGYNFAWKNNLLEECCKHMK